MNCSLKLYTQNELNKLEADQLLTDKSPLYCKRKDVFCKMSQNCIKMTDSELIQKLIELPEKDAVELFEKYKKYCDTPEIAAENVGYLLGYFSKQDAKIVAEKLKIVHPYFLDYWNR